MRHLPLYRGEAVVCSRCAALTPTYRPRCVYCTWPLGVRDPTASEESPPTEGETQEMQTPLYVRVALVVLLLVGFLWWLAFIVDVGRLILGALAP